MLFLSTTIFGQTPIITMIGDGDCTGGSPKVLEIYADGAVDFSLYSLEKSANGGAWGNTFNLSALGTVTDQFVYVYLDDPSFANEYPSATNTLATTNQSVNFNGDDAVRIVDGSSNVIDQYGQDNTDGTGTFWEYQDGYAKRNNSTGPNAGTFVQANWTFNNGALNGEGTCQGGTAFETIIGIGTYTSAPSPTINASTSSLTGFTYVEGSGPSAEQSFTVEGSDLTNDITVTAPTNYEISETSGSGFTNSITLTQSSGSVATTTIYVRLASGLTAAGSPYNETANITSTGATQVDVDFNGTVTAAPTPTINVSTSSLTGFTYVEGAGPSAEQSFTIEGSNLTADISIAAPTNYEISETSGSGFTNSITLTQSSGSVATTTIYVRMVSGLMNANSPFNETVTATSAGATDATVDVEGTVTVATAVNISTNSLTGFSYLQTTGGPSNFQSFDVDGSGLTGDIDITAPANYEISATSGSGYTTSLSLTPITGTVSATTIYVRLKGSLLAVNSPFNEDITVSSTGVSDQTIALEGEVIDNVGIQENKATSFSVYPNPFTSNFTIETNGNKAQVQLTDVLGKIVYNETITGNKTVVNFDIPAGIYFITVTQNDAATTKKIIKK